MKYKGWIPPRRCLFFRQWIYFTGRSYTAGEYIRIIGFEWVERILR